MFTNEELHNRIKLLEEELAYLHRDMANLIKNIEAIKPEVHTHYTLITENIQCTACDPNNTNDLTELS